MKGAQKRIERDLELALFTAWNTARLTAFHGGKLKSLSEELKHLNPGPKKQQTADQIVEAMRMIRETMAGAMTDKPQPA